MSDTQHDADTLARFLDGDGSLNGRVTDETRALAGLAHRLEGAAAQPQPSRRRELRDELLEAARERQAAPPLRARLRRWLTGGQPGRPRVPAMPRLAAATRTTAATRLAAATRTAAAPRVAALVGAAIVVVSGSGLAYGTEAALPGDTLYSMKLAVEDTRLAFENDRSARGTMHLDRAAERISEAEASAAGGDDRGAALALRHANDSARAGAGAILFSYRADEDQRLIDRLAKFTTTQSGRLTTLATGLDGEAAQAAESTLVAFEQIQAQATALGGVCPGCDEPAPVSDHGSASGDQEPTTQVEPFESPERENAESGEGGEEPPSSGDTEPEGTTPQLTPEQPRDAAPETPAPEGRADTPASMPRPWNPDEWETDAWDGEKPWDPESWEAEDWEAEEAPLDPPEPEEEDEREGLLPDGDGERPDLPF